MTFAGNLTLPTLGEGQNGPQRNKCLRNSENRKKFFKKITNFAIPKPLRSTKCPSLHLIYLEMLQNPLVILKKPSFLLHCLLIVALLSKNPQKAQGR